jgi:hypothetical protein
MVRPRGHAREIELAQIPKAKALKAHPAAAALVHIEASSGRRAMSEAKMTTPTITGHNRRGFLPF